MKYLNGKIYKLIDNTNGNIYIGSTCAPLKERLQGHKDSYNRNKKKDGKGNVSYNIIKNNDYRIELLENFPCKSRQELFSKEREYIENNKCINIKRPIITHQELLDKRKKWKTNNKDKVAKYLEKNKDKIAESKRKWANNNKDKIAEWFKNNKDKVTEQKKNYYEANKAKWNNYNKGSREKIQCDICNTTICRDSLWRHKKTPKCKNYKKE